MNPNERFGAQVIFVFVVFVCFIVGSVAYTKGIEHGYNGKRPYSAESNYYTGSDYNIDDYLIDGKKQEGGIEHGKYENSTGRIDEESRDTGKTDRTSAESDKRRKQEFKKNLQDMGRFLQNSWYISVSLLRSNYFHSN